MVPLLHFVAPLTALCPMHSKLYRAIQHYEVPCSYFSLILIWEAFKIWLEGFEWQSKKELLKQVPHKMQKHLGMGCKMFYRSTNTIQITNKATKDIPYLFSGPRHQLPGIDWIFSVYYKEMASYWHRLFTLKKVLLKIFG